MRPALSSEGGNAGRALADAVTTFVTTLSVALGADPASGDAKAAAQRRTAATDDALAIVAGFIDADGAAAEVELDALLHAFPHARAALPEATATAARRAGLVTGARRVLTRVPASFTALLERDRREGTAWAWSYYLQALGLAHVVVSLDGLATVTELQALDGFRTMLLSAYSAAGNPLPGAPARAGSAVDGAHPGRGARPDVAAAGATDIAAPPTPDAAREPARPLEELLAELENLVGLAPVKAEIRRVADRLQIAQLRRERGLPVRESSRHLVFTGNPGTGKTTVARLLAQIYRSLGLVTHGHLVETDRSGLVGRYVGHTATQVTEIFERARGGMLLIDEAYALARGGENDFGREAIDTLVKLAEDQRKQTVVVMAGYPDEMAILLAANPGLESRFPTTIAFPDYSDDELLAIFEHLAEAQSYRLTPAAGERVRAWFQAAPRGRGFGNGRAARNLFEAAVDRQASRLVGRSGRGEPLSDEALIRLLPADVPPPPRDTGDD